jgi:hypothetical protein
MLIWRVRAYKELVSGYIVGIGQEDFNYPGDLRVSGMESVATVPWFKQVPEPWLIRCIDPIGNFPDEWGNQELRAILVLFSLLPFIGP